MLAVLHDQIISDANIRSRVVEHADVFGRTGNGQPTCLPFGATCLKWLTSRSGYLLSPEVSLT